MPTILETNLSSELNNFVPAVNKKLNHFNLQDQTTGKDAFLGHTKIFSQETVDQLHSMEGAHLVSTFKKKTLPTIKIGKKGNKICSTLMKIDSDFPFNKFYLKGVSTLFLCLQATFSTISLCGVGLKSYVLNQTEAWSEGNNNKVPSQEICKVKKVIGQQRKNIKERAIVSGTHAVYSDYKALNSVLSFLTQITTSPQIHRLAAFTHSFSWGAKLIKIGMSVYKTYKKSKPLAMQENFMKELKPDTAQNLLNKRKMAFEQKLQDSEIKAKFEQFMESIEVLSVHGMKIQLAAKGIDLEHLPTFSKTCSRQELLAFLKTNKTVLHRAYVEHKIVLDTTAKQVLREWALKKQKMEREILQFDYSSRLADLSISLLRTLLDAGLTISSVVGLYTCPLLVFPYITLGAIVSTVALSAFGVAFLAYKRPYYTIFNKNYCHVVLAQTKLKIMEIWYWKTTEYVALPSEAGEERDQVISEIRHLQTLEGEVKKYQKEMSQNVWDTMVKTDVFPKFKETVNTLNDIISSSEDPEITNLLRRHLGIDLSKIQQPSNNKTNVSQAERLEKKIKKFLSLDSEQLLAHIKSQNKNTKAET